MLDRANPCSAPRPPSRALRLLLAAGLSGVLVAAVCFFAIGRWLVVEDSLGNARAITVLSGSMTLRTVEAAKLYRQGYAPEVWLTHSAEPGATLAAMGIPFAGEDYYE